MALAPTATGKARLLFSEDLGTWERIIFPTAGIDSLLRTPAGWIATGSTSLDGRAWVERPDVAI